MEKLDDLIVSVNQKIKEHKIQISELDKRGEITKQKTGNRPPLVDKAILDHNSNINTYRALLYYLNLYKDILNR